MPRIPFFTIPCFIPRDYSVISAPKGGSGMPRIPFFTIPCFIPRDYSVISAPKGGSGMPRIPFFTIPCFCRQETGKKRTGIRKKLHPNGKTIESGLSVKKYLFNFAAAWLTGCQSNNL